MQVLAGADIESGAVVTAPAPPAGATGAKFSQAAGEVMVEGASRSTRFLRATAPGGGGNPRSVRLVVEMTGVKDAGRGLNPKPRS